MSHFDVFNGDADGICALHQLRLAAPRESTLGTGRKRDIQLLGRVTARPGDSVTVLDISLDRNRDALLDLLDKGVQVDYFDHHFPGLIPEHPALRAHIDAAPDVCTSASWIAVCRAGIASGPWWPPSATTWDRRRTPSRCPAA